MISFHFCVICTTFFAFRITYYFTKTIDAYSITDFYMPTKTVACKMVTNLRDGPVTVSDCDLDLNIWWSCPSNKVCTVVQLTVTGSELNLQKGRLLVL